MCFLSCLLVTSFLQAYGWCILIVVALYFVFRDKIDAFFAGVNKKYENARENMTYGNVLISFS